MVGEDRDAVMAGGCQCGAVRYVLYAAPEKVHLCHCRKCQRAVGGPFAALAPVRRKDFAWTAGTATEFPSSEVAKRGFCSACGTPLTFGYLDSEWIDVTIGSLDEPNLAPPEMHYGVESRVRWFADLNDLPGFETKPGGLTGKSR